jgi:hypothetical protein
LGTEFGLQRKSRSRNGPPGLSQPWSGLAMMGSPMDLVVCGQQALGREHAALEPSYAIST